MHEFSSSSWACKDRTLKTGERPLIMGILNVTPDSFSDGGRFDGRDAAITRGLAMIAEGADIVDIGGESTRPGAAPVEASEEIRRVVPVIEALRMTWDGPLSVDTAKAAVAEKAIEAGADIVNDVSALTADERMASVAVESRVGLVLMHMLGTPRTMQQDPRYDDVVRDVRDYLARRMSDLAAKGVRPEAMVLDPGIGFGKTVEHNLALLRGLPELCAVGRPVLVGLSRKRFLGELTGREVGDRLAGSLAGLAYAAIRGATILRVHDIKESCDAVHVLDRLRQEDAI